MTDLRRVRVGFTGFAGAPGVATFYTRDTMTFLESLHTLWAGIATLMPPAVTIQVENVGDIINDATGVLVGSWEGSPQTPLTGTSGLGYAAPVGGLIRWETTQIFDGSRLRGRTFVIPMSAAEYGPDGTLVDADLVGIRAAINTFQAEQDTSFVIWHRPRAATLLKAARAGNNALVVSGTFADKAVVLRSRRD